MKSRLWNALLIIASTAISLLLAEFVSRWLLPINVPTGNQYVFYRFDPVLGWTNQNNARGTFQRAEFSYPLLTNRHGMRYREVSKERTPGVFRIAVLGDSFTWGIGVSDEERFTERVESIFNHRVEMLNFGVSGYGPIQYLLQLDRILEFQPNAILIAFCLGNDFQDNVFYRRYGYYKPYVALTEPIEIRGYPPSNSRLRNRSDGLLAVIHNNSALLQMTSRAIDRFKTRSASPDQQGPSEFDENGRDIYIEPEDANKREIVSKVVSVNSEILREIKSNLDARHVQFAIVTVPTKCEYGRCFPGAPNTPNLRARDFLLRATEQNAIPLIDTVGILSIDDFWALDGHWRPSGHTKTAQSIAIWLRSNWLNSKSNQ